MNLRLALRRLRAAPGFTFAAALTLALGIGANALTFSAIRGLLVKPLPFPDADDLVWVQGADPARALSAQPVDGDEVGMLASGMRSAEGIGVIGTRMLIRAAAQRREEWRGLWVTANALPLLKMSPALGRTFTAADVHDASTRPAMIGYERWQRDFGGDPAIVGRVVHFEDNKAITVIGVLPRGLEFPFGRAPGAGTGSEFLAGQQDFWTLGQTRTDEYPGGVAFVRLRGGVSIESAQAEAETVIARLPRPRSSDATRTVRLIAFRDHALGVLRPALPLLEGFAALVLLIACANLANLVLARAVKGRGELAVRTALGASTRNLISIALAETLIVCAAGAGAGLLIAAAGRSLLVKFAAGQIGVIEAVRIDPGTVLFATLIAAVAAGAFALLPLTVVREAPALAMLDRGARGHTLGRRQRRTFSVLVVVQVAVTLVLLNAAALVFRSLSRLVSVDTGYQAASVIAADILLFEPPAVFVPYFQRLHERLKALPGVEAVGLVQSTPLTGKWTFRERLALPGAPTDPRNTLEIAGTFVAFDYFSAMGIPILAGRDFSPREYLSGDLRSLIVNDVAARLFFPGEMAIGRSLVLNGETRAIVGVVKGTRDVRLETAAEPQFYQPAFTGGSQVIVRTSADPAAFSNELRRELAASDPRVIVKRVEPLTRIGEASIFERRLAARLLIAFGGLALALAIVGLYGVLNFTTVQRHREIGIRAALGARPADLVRLVMRQGLGMTAIGIAAGLIVTAAVTAWLDALLFGVTPWDAWTLAGGVVSLSIAAAAASMISALRSGNVDPAIALRAE